MSRHHSGVTSVAKAEQVSTPARKPAGRVRHAHNEIVEAIHKWHQTLMANPGPRENRRTALLTPHVEHEPRPSQAEVLEEVINKLNGTTSEKAASQSGKSDSKRARWLTSDEQAQFQRLLNSQEPGDLHAFLKQNKLASITFTVQNTAEIQIVTVYRSRKKSAPLAYLNALAGYLHPQASSTPVMNSPETLSPEKMHELAKQIMQADNTLMMGQEGGNGAHTIPQTSEM